MKTWLTWEEPDMDRALVLWKERGIHVVFPLAWAKRHGERPMIERSKARVAEVEKAAGRHIVPGSVLLAFSRHRPRETIQTIDPGVPRSLI